MSKKRSQNSICAALIVAFGLAGVPSRADGPTEEDYRVANKLYRRLTSGEFLVTSNPLYPVVLSKVVARDYMGAADAITHPDTGADSFYNNTVADLWQTINNTGTAVTERNEIVAMLLCATKYDMTPLELLTSNFICYDETKTPAGVGYAIDDTGCGATSMETSGTLCNTGHYMAVWRTTNPKRSLTKTTRPGSPATGILTSWPWAKNFDLAGTNRRNEKAVNEHLYLATMEALRADGGIPTDGVRIDVPLNDPLFTNDCAKCHARMDHLIGAYMDKDVINDGKTFVRRFKDKLSVIENDGGRNLLDTSFKYFFNQQQNQILGINESKHVVQEFSPGVKFIEGNGLNDIAYIIGNSRGYNEGIVKRIVAQMYMGRMFSIQSFSQEDWDTLNGQADTIRAFTDTLVQEQNLRRIWERIAIWYTVGVQ